MNASHVRVIVLRAAGTNCDRETVYAFEKAGATVDRVHVNRLAEGSASLMDYQVLAIPGGFTYGDDIAAGRVLANEMNHRVGDQVRSFIDDGRLVIGICNGFQVLVKMGLLPGWEDSPHPVTLTYNDSNKFEDRWVYLKVVASTSPFLRKEEVIYLPVAHGEGKFVVDSDESLERLEEAGQVVLRYCDQDGKQADYPLNPNGSVRSIAGICNADGNVLGLMPHPERNVEPYHHPRWSRAEGAARADGMRFFINAVSHFT